MAAPAMRGEGCTTPEEDHIGHGHTASEMTMPRRKSRREARHTGGSQIRGGAPQGRAASASWQWRMEGAGKKWSGMKRKQCGRK